MGREFDRKIVLEDGSEYYGYGFGSMDEAVCEITFNTSPVGYQEIISDPSYTDKMVVMAYPLIGNYGIADDDFETKVPSIGGLIVREYNNSPSNFRYTKTLSEIMEENRIPGISGLDTRKLTRSIRDNGSCKVMITDASTPHENAMATIRSTNISNDGVARVSCKKKWYSRTANPKFNVVAIDCGIKLNIIRCLNARSCNVTIVPYNTGAEEIAAMRPDGILISNGPGNPEYVKSTIELVREIRGKYPLLGIGLGHQIIALAYGAEIYKLKQAHGNHPVRNLMTGKIEITSQSHTYVVKSDSLEGTGLTETHINVLDNTNEGIQSEKDMLLSVQYHPESAPGPQDSMYLFDEFITLMKEAKNNA
ncbi:MAG: glutamine-hydrolyzing carbamoyl-phosphate synthase small subunit [Eubacteriales bacterium]|nr:glutamine-hydrolyzing carbamoyl-phosphate synthase small subunit [Eubacteriales bacterium]